MNNANAISLLTEIYDSLAGQSDLSPRNPYVNTCLGRLVATLQAWQRSGFGNDLADHPELVEVSRELPGLCAKAECEMEKWWCQHILASRCPGEQALSAFWYVDEYDALCASESALLGSEGGGDFVFLGSGALPLTAIWLARRNVASRVTCVDCDGQACDLAQTLVRRLGLAQRVEIRAGRAEDYGPAADETVICASLLDAPTLYDRLYQRRARRLIIRDAEGPYRLCYRPARLPERGYIERAKSSPSAERINTSRYFTLEAAYP